MNIAVMQIEGAVVMPDMEKIDVNGEPGFIIPALNNNYYLACHVDDVLLASKNGKDFVIALAIEFMGKRLTAPEAIKMLKETEDGFHEYGEYLKKLGDTNECFGTACESENSSRYFNEEGSAGYGFSLYNLCRL